MANKYIFSMIPFPGKFSFVLSVSGYSDEEWLSFPEKTPPGAFLKAVRVSGKGTKESKEKKERKETGSRKRKPAAEGADAGADARTVRIQKSPEAFLPQGSC